MTTGMHTMQLISLDAIIMLIVGMEIRCKGCKELCKPSRHEASSNLPTREDLLAIKASKRVGTRFLFIFDETYDVPNFSLLFPVVSSRHRKV